MVEWSSGLMYRDPSYGHNVSKSHLTHSIIGHWTILWDQGTGPLYSLTFSCKVKPRKWSTGPTLENLCLNSSICRVENDIFFSNLQSRVELYFISERIKLLSLSFLLKLGIKSSRGLYSFQKFSIQDAISTTANDTNRLREFLETKCFIPPSRGKKEVNDSLLQQ